MAQHLFFWFHSDLHSPVAPGEVKQKTFIGKQLLCLYGFLAWQAVQVRLKPWLHAPVLGFDPLS